MWGTSEIHFEVTVFDFLKESNLYSSSKSGGLNLDLILDVAQLECFITETQPRTWLKLQNQFPENTIEAVANEFSKLRDKEAF